MRLTRRAFLRAGLGGAVAGGVGLAVLGPGRVKRAVTSRLLEGLPDAPPAPLDEPTRAALQGFLATYLPPSAATPAAVSATAAWADAEARGVPGFGRALGEGLDALGGDSGRALFARGEPEARRAALGERFAAVGARHYLTPSGRAYTRFRHFVLPALVAEHFAGPAGWAVVGYATFPGRCGAPRAYTTAPV